MADLQKEQHHLEQNTDASAAKPAIERKVLGNLNIIMKMLKN